MVTITSNLADTSLQSYAPCTSQMFITYWLIFLLFYSKTFCFQALFCLAIAGVDSILECQVSVSYFTL